MGRKVDLIHSLGSCDFIWGSSWNLVPVILSAQVVAVNSSCCPPPPVLPPLSEGKTILGVIYSVLLWVDMNAAQAASPSSSTRTSIAPAIVLVHVASTSVGSAGSTLRKRTTVAPRKRGSAPLQKLP